MEPANPELKVSEISDVRVLDGLVRAHVLQAEVLGRSSPYFMDSLVMAYTYILRLWQVGGWILYNLYIMKLSSID